MIYKIKSSIAIITPVPAGAGFLVRIREFANESGSDIGNFFPVIGKGEKAKTV